MYVLTSRRHYPCDHTSQHTRTGTGTPSQTLPSPACPQDFARMFGNPLKGKSYKINWDGYGKPWCGPSWLGCVFL